MGHESKRWHDALAASNRYAPAPRSSTLTYGFVAFALAGVCLAAFSGFYSFDLLPYPAWIVALLLLAFLTGIVLRRVRKMRHATAFAVEVGRHDEPDRPGNNGGDGHA